MVIEVVREEESGGWTTTLCRANLRPSRRYVEVEGPVGDDGGAKAVCVGFADETVEADRLFDAVAGTVRLVATGEAHAVDWAELPEGFTFR